MENSKNDDDEFKKEDLVCWLSFKIQISNKFKKKKGGGA